MINLSAQMGCADLIELLIVKGADPNIPNDKGNTPLHYAVAYGFFKSQQALIEGEADEKIVNRNGKNPWEGL